MISQNNYFFRCSLSIMNVINYASMDINFHLCRWIIFCKYITYLIWGLYDYITLHQLDIGRWLHWTIRIENNGPMFNIRSSNNIINQTAFMSCHHNQMTEWFWGHTIFGSSKAILEYLDGRYNKINWTC